MGINNFSATNKTNMKYIMTIVLLFISTTIQNKPWLYPELKVVDKIEDIIMPDIMNKIAYQESRNNWYAINHNTNGTIDLGRYQINTVAFKELNNVYNMEIPDKDTFLSDTLLQKKYALVLYEHNTIILKRRKIPVNDATILLAWKHSGYNVNW
jgi:hypothetical protein